MEDNLQVRAAEREDCRIALRLNEAAVPAVNSIPEAVMVRFYETAPYFRVAVLDGNVVGFLIGLDPSADYDSPNFQAFKKMYESFIYVDRIVIGEKFRRMGIGNLLYRDLEIFATDRFPRITCEVNTKPYNGASLDFHEAQGFRQVGSQDTEGGAKTVALLTKRVAVR
ncbi:MAG: GNAT family N-acetyltransferase [Gemmatimonadota bacterium]|nr:GNAT family N-acetyltransferase [Gemmatimonadota bacterium]